MITIGLAWHWDTEEWDCLPLTTSRLITRLFTPYGLKEYPRTEPNICMDLANILLVRIGRRLGLQTVG